MHFIPDSLYLLIFNSHYRLFAAGTGEAAVHTTRGAAFFCDRNMQYDASESNSNVEAYREGDEPIVIIRVADISSVFPSTSKAQNYMDKLLRHPYFRPNASTERRWIEAAVHTLNEACIIDTCKDFWGRVYALETKSRKTGKPEFVDLSREN